MTDAPTYGEVVDIDWGLTNVVGRVVRVYGPPLRLQVTVELTPELSSYVVSEPTEVTVPLGAVHRRTTTA